MFTVYSLNGQKLSMAKQVCIHVWVILTAFCPCVVSVTNEAKYLSETGPYHFELDRLVISATLERNRIACGLKCTSASNCVAFLYGTLDPSTAKDTCYTGSLWSYSGQMSVSALGYTCQAWQLNYPHSHWHHDQPGNYCRDPTRSGYMWCYTTDPSKRWDYCDIAKCYPDTNCRLLAGPLPVVVYNLAGFNFYRKK